LPPVVESRRARRRQRLRKRQPDGRWLGAGYPLMHIREQLRFKWLLPIVLIVS
jgi:hypothetical protein